MQWESSFHHCGFSSPDCVLSLAVPGQGEPQVLLFLGDVAWPDPAQASFQCESLSPQEKHLAATVRSSRSEEAGCAVARLGSTPAVTHIQTPVFSFEWVTDNILFYTSQKNLRSFQVYSLVFGEEQPQRILVCEEQEQGQGEPQVLLSLGDVAWPDPEGASFQRVRLSPQEKYLAATVRSGRSEEASCAVVRLGSTPAVTHIQTAVFSFEWATDNILFYTSQKNLRSFQVYSLVFGEEQPQRILVCEEQDPR
ncbi:UNVERIFIED_CONTAM: hypothetical protein FKN15_010634 [Acipenser sinensis]